MACTASDEGPLIPLPPDSVPDRSGSFGAGGEDDVDEEDTPHWHACEGLNADAGVVDLGRASALLLGNRWIADLSPLDGDGLRAGPRQGVGGGRSRRGAASAPVDAMEPGGGAAVCWARPPLRLGGLRAGRHKP